MVTFSLNSVIKDFKLVDWLDDAKDIRDAQATSILAKAGFISKSHKYDRPDCYLDSQLNSFKHVDGVCVKVYDYITDADFKEPIDTSLEVGSDRQLDELDKEFNVLEFFVLCSVLDNQYGVDILILIEKLKEMQTKHRVELLHNALANKDLDEYQTEVLILGLSNREMASEVLKNLRNYELLDSMFKGLTKNIHTLEQHRNCTVQKNYREEVLRYAKYL